MRQIGGRVTGTASALNSECEHRPDAAWTTAATSPGLGHLLADRQSAGKVGRRVSAVVGSHRDDRSKVAPSQAYPSGIGTEELKRTVADSGSRPTLGLGPQHRSTARSQGAAHGKVAIGDGIHRERR